MLWLPRASRVMWDGRAFSLDKRLEFSAILGGGTQSGSLEPKNAGRPDTSHQDFVKHPFMFRSTAGFDPVASVNSKTSYYDTTMKQLITKEEVGDAIRQLIGQGKKPTLVALHAALENKGSISTFVRLKGEIDAEAQRSTDSPDALEAFREVWDLARAEGRTEQEQAVAELRDNLRSLASENERLEGMAAAAQKRATDFEGQKFKAETELGLFRISAERDLSRAASTMRDSGIQAETALRELADARSAHATQVATLQAELTAAHRSAHEFELQLVRARALLEAKGLADEKLPVSES